MSKQSVTRRAFLVRAAAGAGTLATAGVVAEAGAAVGHEPYKAATAEPAGAKHGAFFNGDAAATVEALVERLMPGAPGRPGARDAAVLNYIDLALAGPYAELQDFYRRGLAALDAYCRSTHGERFLRLGAAGQDAVVAALESGQATGFTWPTAQAFFNTLRTHTMEGMFADPIYGGNRNFAGWRLVGFPGAQPVFTPGDMQSTQRFTRAPLIGLQQQDARPRKGGK
jgi:gluconate 2-dehydrogenase gamma chain